MSFVQDDDAGKNDKMLFYAMVGIVVLTAMVFGLNYFTKKDAPTPVAPPAVSMPQQAAQDPVNNQAPTPAVTPQQPEETASSFQPSPPPVQVQPQSQPPAAAPGDDYSNTPAMQNSKLRGMRNMTDQG